MKKIISGIVALTMLTGMTGIMPKTTKNNTGVYQMYAEAADYGTLSNPNATAETKSLYSFLCDTYGKGVLAGQQESTWMGSEDYEFNIIQNASGKLPVVRGLDYMGDDFAGCNRRAKAWAAKGGIVTICWHCGSDFRGSHTESLESNLDWSKALTPGTAEYNNLIAGMDKGAKALLELQEAGVPVIWRPFHETDGGWFWWSKGGAENFKKLWRIMYDRYTNYWGLNNLIWICGYSGEVRNGWYPGDDVVDIIGADTYVNHTNSLVSMYNKTAAIADKPVCLHENGPIPDPAKMKADGAKWLWFMTWHTSFIDDGTSNPTNHIKNVYTSDYTITLDEIPDVYNYKSGSPSAPEVEFELKKYPVGDVNKGDKITFNLTGTANAYTNGGIAYADGGEWVADEWEGTYNSAGTLNYTWTAPKDLTGVEFQIWWAGLWDDATASNKEAQSSLKSINSQQGSSSVTPSTPPPASKGGFYADGDIIRDANGQELIMRGVNIPYAWFKNNAEQAIRAAAGKGTNTLRIVCEYGAANSKTSAAELKKVIDWCEANKQVCILEVHDATGKDNVSYLLDAAKYWAEMREVLNENKDTVIVNIANEWYGSWGSAEWAEGYKQAIKIMRDAGIENMIMVDSAGWGQYATSIGDKGKEIVEADPNHNIVFSIHFYGSAGGTAQKVNDNLNYARTCGAPVIVGEFGYYHSDGDVDEGAIMSYCNKNDIGYLAWSWKGNGGGVEYLDLVSDWDGNQHTEWGDIFFNAMDRKGELSSVYTGVVTNPPSTPSSPSTMSSNIVISRDVPAYSGGGTASKGNNSAYWDTWDSGSGDYLAYDLSGVPANQRKQVLAVWYNNSTYDNIGQWVTRSAEPVDYVIEVNSAAGGSYPANGWKTVKTVTGNGLSSRQCVIDFEGYNWIRIRVTKALGDKVSINFDIHDVSQGVSDSWIFFGDSITAGSMVNNSGTSFAARVNAIDSRFYPAQENGGIGGTVSGQGKENIEKWLSDSSAKYVSIAYGTNDCWGNANGMNNYYNNTKYMIDAVLAAGKIPVLPKIPYSTNSDVGNNVGKYNAKIDQLYSEYGDKLIHGPDFEAFFKANPNLLSSDGVHPSGDGYEAMRKLWAETMYENVYSRAQSPEIDLPEIVKGDINADGKCNIADLVALQKWILGDSGEKLADWKAGDLCEDNRLDSFDIVMMRQLLVGGNASASRYEAENASMSGSNEIISDSAASGGKVVGSFADENDSLSFNINVPANGDYQLIFSSMGIGGDKENILLVDNKEVGNLTSIADAYMETSLRNVNLTSGKHTVTIKPSWGWVNVDYLKVVKE